MWRNSSKKPFLVFDIFGRNGDDVFTRFQIDQKTLLGILINNIDVIQRKAWFHKIVLIVYDNSIYARRWLKMALILDFNSQSCQRFNDLNNSSSFTCMNVSYLTVTLRGGSLQPMTPLCAHTRSLTRSYPKNSSRDSPSN